MVAEIGVTFLAQRAEQADASSTIVKYSECEIKYEWFGSSGAFQTTWNETIFSLNICAHVSLSPASSLILFFSKLVFRKNNTSRCGEPRKTNRWPRESFAPRFLFSLWSMYTKLVNLKCINNN